LKVYFVARNDCYNADGQIAEAEAGTVTGGDDGAWAAFVSKQQLVTSYDGNGRKSRDVSSAGGATYGVTDYSYDGVGRRDCTAVRMNTAVSAMPTALTGTITSAAIRSTSSIRWG